MQQQNQNQNQSSTNSATVVALIIGLIVGFAAGSLWGGSNDSRGPAEEGTNATSTEEVSNENNDSNGEETQEVTEEGDVTLIDRSGQGMTDSEGQVSVSVVDQSAGGTASVESVSFPSDSWVAVREVKNGSFANILGAKWLPAGSHEDVEVLLQRATETGNEYRVVVYADNGDREFDHEADSLFTEDGSIVFDSFTTVEEGSEDEDEN